MIFFAAPPSNTRVDSKDLFPDEPNKYPPVSAWDYLKQRLEQIYGNSYRKKIGQFYQCWSLLRYPWLISPD